MRVKYSFERMLLSCLLLLLVYLINIAEGIAIMRDPVSIKQPEPYILDIGHYNSDAYQDTVLGIAFGKLSSIVTEIRWGRPVKQGPDSSGTIPINTSTRFVYPAWREWGNAYTNEFLSTDTLRDLVLYMWGKKPAAHGNKHLFRAVAIFGQKNLDTVRIINLENIDTLQTNPFYAQQLILDKDFWTPGSPEPSGKSYFFPRIEDHSKLDSTARDNNKESPWSVKLAPDPASGSITVYTQGLSGGNYTIEILSLEGTSVRTLPLQVAGGESSALINLEQIASGYYMIIVRNEHLKAGPFPFVTVH